MAVKNYQWAAAMTVESGGYNGELISIEQDGVEVYSGAIDPSQVPKTFNLPWNTETDMSGSATYTYTYRDSETADNNNSTKVAITIQDSWTVSIDNRNYMTVTVATTLVSAVRTVIGSPSNINRRLWLRRTSNGIDYNPFPMVDNANTAHTIASNVNMGTFTFTLAPGENMQESTAWWRNTTVGHESDHIPNTYTDILGIGIHFKNILPADYRPGATQRNGNWLSHNRDDGWAGVWDSSDFMEMRTLDGADGTDNPPYIKHTDEWKNQRLVGQD